MFDMDCGVQPLDGLMEQWGLENHDLVEVSTEQLPHKQAQKGRKGRRLSLQVMQKETSIGPSTRSGSLAWESICSDI